MTASTATMTSPTTMTPETATLDERTAASTKQAVVAVYGNHDDAEAAVRRLLKAGIPKEEISIIGKDWHAREKVEGFYQPSDAIKEGAATGAWVGGLFGMLLGFGLFVVPIAGTLVVLGPLSGLIAGAVGGAGVGALVGGLMALGIPKEEALKYQVRLEAGELLVIVCGSDADIEKAREVLSTSNPSDLQVHSTASI